MRSIDGVCPTRVAVHASHARPDRALRRCHVRRAHLSGSRTPSGTGIPTRTVTGHGFEVSPIK
jgi:hypothetical protein